MSLPAKKKPFISCWMDGKYHMRRWTGHWGLFRLYYASSLPKNSHCFPSAHHSLPNASCIYVLLSSFFISLFFVFISVILGLGFLKRAFHLVNAKTGAQLWCGSHIYGPVLSTWSSNKHTCNTRATKQSRNCTSTDCNSWDPEVKIPLIFYIEFILYNDKPLKTDLLWATRLVKSRIVGEQLNWPWFCREISKYAAKNIIYRRLAHEMKHKIEFTRTKFLKYMSRKITHSHFTFAFARTLWLGSGGNRSPTELNGKTTVEYVM